MRVLLVLPFLLLCIGSTSCHPKVSLIEPEITYSPPQRLLKQLPSPFPTLLPEEKRQEWAKELGLGRAFILEMDFYRALTCFKRALFLIPKSENMRRLEIEYDIFLSYSLAGKYQDCIETFEGGELFFATELFPAIDELLILLYEAYLKNDQPEKALRILSLISMKEGQMAQNLSVSTAVLNADFPQMQDALMVPEDCEYSLLQENLSRFIDQYETKKKSVSKAQMLNAFLPGAGYYYVGQKKTALTSFLINALFITAAWQLFDRGYFAGGIIVASLETGWYLGGINGAGIEVKEYNQYLYQTLGKEMLIENRLFPVLMLEKGF